MKRLVLGVIVIVQMLLLLWCAPRGNAGSDKGAWKPFLPADAYKELTQRSIKHIQELARSSEPNAAVKIQVEANILFGYTRSGKNPKDDTKAMRETAVLAATLARRNELKRLTDLEKLVKAPPKVTLVFKLSGTPGGPGELKLDDMMEIFRNKTKGGEGLHAELQYHPKLKNLNGGEALIGALASKKLSDENIAKVAKELPNFAYRTAVVGTLTYEYAPAKETKKWHDYSLQMRDSSIALAEAAQKKDGDGILKAAEGLQNSCTNCHRDFRKQ